jgi:hypothetical protein
MLPLVSKTIPTARGASSLANWGDLLFFLLFEQPEVILFKAGDDPVHRVGDDYRDQHECAVNANAGARRCVGSAAPPRSWLKVYLNATVVLTHRGLEH